MTNAHRDPRLTGVAPVLAAATLALACLGWFSDTTAQSAASPAFVETECWFSGINARCGFMHVPENHRQPDSPLIKFPVVVLSTTKPDTGLEPIVVLGGGGPGNSLGLDADGIYYHWQTFWDLFVSQGREVILLEQRGVGRAEPTTHCPEVVSSGERLFRVRPQWDRDWARTREVLTACRQRLLAGGVDLANYDTRQSAADVEALRVALGVDRWVLYGASYAAQIAFETMRRYPQSVRAVVLDSPSVPEFYYYPNLGKLSDAALDDLLQRCATNDSCTKRYPNLRNELLELLQALEREPVTVVLTKPGSGERYDFVMDRQRLADVLFASLYEPDALKTVPAAIHGAYQGRTFALAPLVSGFLQLQLDTQFGDGLSVAVDCREEVANTALGSISAYTERYSGRQTRRIFAETVRVCDELALGSAGAEIKQPVVSDLPTLILAGEADPITPADLSEEASRHLSNSTLIKFSLEAHYLFYNECARQLVRHWLEGDVHRETASCASDASSITIEASASGEIE